jgi:hypothetical protein
MNKVFRDFSKYFQASAGADPQITLRSLPSRSFPIYNMFISLSSLYSISIVNWKECGRKRLWPNSKILSLHLSGGTEENHGRLSQDNRDLGRDLNPRPLEYEAGKCQEKDAGTQDCSYYSVKSLRCR